MQNFTHRGDGASTEERAQRSEDREKKHPPTPLKGGRGRDQKIEGRRLNAEVTGWRVIRDEETVGLRDKETSATLANEAS
jgi:hypothetical protein